MAFQENSKKPLTYSSYLKVDELLDLQRPLSDGPEHDEMLFIIIHQVYELWFRQVLHELDELSTRFLAGDTAGSLATLKRTLTIFKTLVAQVDVLETITPVSFGSFRDRLESASGFQSAQFREVEILLGARSRQIVEHHPAGSPGRECMERRLTEPSLWDNFLHYLALQDLPVPSELLGRDVSEPAEASDAVQEILLEIYRNHPVASMVCERLLDLDEGLQEWRYRHVKMVERTIGCKPGTGGSSGAEYLRRTLFRPVFPDLWAIRAQL
ncbi:MAG: tryptophan 2,3-dioxygenase family protein [Acidobacteria bacterium]|nr:tryptophan 2,3-dioxygenase family protein [Acidobacteriota bacterium]